MGTKKLSGAKTILYTSARGTKVDTGALDPNEWFEIAAVAATASALPIGKITAVFRSPDTGSLTPITLGSGDEVFPLNLTLLCKTDADIAFEEGSIEVSDDCSGDFTEEILDSFKKISGNFGGFLRFDDETGEIETVTEEILNRFINIVSDDGDGGYTVSDVANEKLIAFMCLNRDAAIGEIQNWMIIPVIFTSLGTGSPLKDAQKRDIGWTKGEGYPSLYKRTVFADDVLS